jgi:hypothetical protein
MVPLLNLAPFFMPLPPYNRSVTIKKPPSVSFPWNTYLARPCKGKTPALFYQFKVRGRQHGFWPSSR